MSQSLANRSSNLFRRQFTSKQASFNFLIQHRSFFSAVGVLRSILKIRYIILGSAVGGGIHVNNKYNEWKERLPDFEWIKNLIPDDEKQKVFKQTLFSLKERFTSDDGLIDALLKNSQDTINQFREMLREKQLNRDNFYLYLSPDTTTVDKQSPIKLTNTTQAIKNPFASSSTSGDNLKNSEADQERLQKLHEELITIKRKYQKEIERLENENKELRKMVLLKSDKSQASEKLKKVNKTLIDLYSDVLDELNDYDSNYNTQDHLPRVIVVGDQSAGKTSVLEMIAHARIFPRGAGEMMTRSPVKVTLKEGPYHVARFKNSNREYDLTKENDLAELRQEIEIRMKSKVGMGKSVSKDVIPLTVEGPGIPRMVLIDLPGVISTVTTEMAADTKEAIAEISKHYMSNPNAIILCIQDGSVDAERSIVTDLVSQTDPQGKRTIFVMTKVDLAEKNMSDPNRLKKILDGRLFPMKALGYFAVVTGRSGKDDTITSIKEYEEEFFKNSKLCKQGILSASQCTTQSLSLAVSDCFWKMVKSAVEQQADLYKARKFNLETEWKNNFSKFRELDRDELFEIGKNQILDQLMNLCHFNEVYWETLLFKNLNEKFKMFIFEDIYLPCAEKAQNDENFNVLADIKLKNWIDNILPSATVGVGWQVLSEQLLKVLNNTNENDRNLSEDQTNTENDFHLFKTLKSTVAKEVLDQHRWDSKADDVLKLLQMNAAEDRVVLNKNKWMESAKYLEDLIIDQILATESKLNELIGPNWFDRWTQWKSRNKEELINVNIKNELDNLLFQQNNLKPNLDSDDLLLVKKNLKVKKIEVADEDVTNVWKEMYRINFLKHLLNNAYQCEKYFAHYLYKMESDIACDDIVFFYRIRNVLQTSSKALRHQITNIEIQRLNREIKETLDDFNQDYQRKSTLLTGKRVDLAEELKRVRQIQEKLEEFIAALNNEKYL